MCPQKSTPTQMAIADAATSLVFFDASSPSPTVQGSLSSMK